MTRATFCVDDTLEAILRHAESTSDHGSSFEGPLPSPHIALVKDDGIYLMSPAQPPLLAEDGKKRLVAYAHETKPEAADRWEQARAIAGGDDFVEYFPAADFRKMLDDGAEKILIDFTDDCLAVSYLRRR